MRGFVLLACLVVLGGCASLETRMRERRADRESIEASFASPEPRLPALAAESCAWSRTGDCEERLERMAWDRDPAVRDAAIRTLGEICGDDAREALARIVEGEGASDAMVAAARRCPTADLTLALEGESRSHGDSGAFEERQAWLAWLDGVVAQPPPREKAVELRDRVARALQREYAEGARALEISRTRERAWAAVEAGDLEEAAFHGKTLDSLGAPTGDLLRAMQAKLLARARKLFDESLRARELDRAEKVLATLPVLSLKDPTLATRVEVARYEKLLPKATAMEKLARSGRIDDARAARREVVEGGGETLLTDLAKASRRRSEELIENGRFAEAWTESWSLRETESRASDEFVARFGKARWRSEGLGMSRAQLASFVEDLGEHAPVLARARLEVFRQIDGAAAGRSASSEKAMSMIADDLRRAIERCDEANDDLPAPSDKFSVADMPEALEYVAQRVPTQKQRVDLRRTRDEGKDLVKQVGSQRERLRELADAAERCQSVTKELAWYEGAPPGSEAHAKARSAAKKTQGCLTDLVARVDSFQRQGEACQRYLEKASTALQGALNR